MPLTLDKLVAMLALEKLEEDLFRGESYDLGYPQLFGGHVLGQAISATSQTVTDRQAHSLHGYFLRPGDPNLPVLYQVERIRDGGSFSSRRLNAIQKGQVIFTGMASFQAAEAGFEHQVRMPDVPGPEGLPNYIELMQQWGDQLPSGLHRRLPERRAIEHRPVSMHNPFSPTVQPPIQHIWLRADSLLPADPTLHRCLLGYASDFFLLGTALLPHKVSLWQTGTQMASLDHAIWFHRDVQLDDWLLYSLESPWSGQTRGLSRGHFFDRQGRLIASTAQEGLMRMRKERP